MNQSLSASAGVGSLLSVGTVSAASADAAVQGVVGKSAPSTQSFDQSMQQANQPRSSALSDQSRGGHLLPEGGESLPAADGVEAGEALAVKLVDGLETGEALAAKLVDSADQIEGQVLQDELRQELFMRVDKSVEDIPASAVDGDSALKEIVRHRGVDLSVMADSVLKQVGTHNHNAQSSELNAWVKLESFRGGLLASVVSNEASASVVNQVPQRPLESSLPGQVSEQGSVQSALSAEAGNQLPVSVSNQSEAGFNSQDPPVAAAVERSVENGGAIESGLLAEASRSRSGVASSASVEGAVLPQVMPQAIELNKSEEKASGAASGAEPAPVRSLFAESVAQIVRQAGLANSEQQPAPSSPVAGSVEEAIGRLTVPTGIASEAKTSAETLKREPSVKADAGLALTKIESQLRTQQSEVNAPVPVTVRQHAVDAAVQSGNVLAGQQVAENVRQQVKSGGESDKLKGLELSGRSDARQEALLASFADSLAAAGKARTTAEPVQTVMPEGVRPGVPAWSQAVHNRVMMMASQNGQFAEIKLDPPELGSLLVKLQIKNEQVSVVFNTPHGSVREAIEQSLPRLKEMFAEQGLDLAESSVHDQGDERQHQREAESEGALMGYQSGAADESVPESMHQESLSLVDYYA